MSSIILFAKRKEIIGAFSWYKSIMHLYLVRNVELIDQVKVHEHPQDTFQSQTVIDEGVVELVTERQSFRLRCSHTF